MSNRVNLILRPMLRRPHFRSFQTSCRRKAEAAALLPPRKPIGAFRGGLFGFLLGSNLAGAGVYYYLLEDYKMSNELLTQDFYSLQASVKQVHDHLETVERKLFELEQKTK